MNPEIWGPHAWFFLHSITLAYPDNPSYGDKENVKTFFKSFYKVLPCPKCRIHYENHLERMPITNEIVESKQQLVQWLIDLHNAVNKSTNKPLLTYEDVLLKYTKCYSDDGLSKNTYYAIIAFSTVIIVLLILYIYFKLFS